MFWTLEKLSARVSELYAYRYRDVRKLSPIHIQEDLEGEIGTRVPTNEQWKTVHVGDRWKGRDRYVWLKLTIEVPATWNNVPIVGLFDFGITGPGNNSQFESLLYLNGEPYQGVDMNHREVFLPDAAAGVPYECLFRLWSGLEGGGKAEEQEHIFKQAELAVLDTATDDLYYTARAVAETIRQLQEEDHTRSSLLIAMDRTFRIIDWSKPGSTRFYESIKEAGESLHSQLEAIPNDHPVTVRAIGHTHIDVAWLWRLKHTREKAARSFSTVLRLMEQYPEYIFLQSQPQLYEYLKSDYPEIFTKIKERIKEGRWEAGGAMWLEADCNVTSGESLVRQILYGTRFFEREFGTHNTYLWMPDVFGYSWALPQILKKSGISTFITTKISWNQYNRMPHDTFKWRGIDGSEVLTHFITTPEDNDNVFYTYNGEVTPFTVNGIWKGYRDKGISRELLLSYGYGDGGGGVNREMLELRRRLERMPGLPRTVTGRVDEYFERLHEQVESTDQYVHVWDGELYLEYHRGTYTSQAYNKRMNRKLELQYREVECLLTMVALKTGSWSKYPEELLHKGWKIILRNQFHDIIPGSSIHEVYEDSRIEYQEAEEIALTLRTLSEPVILELSEETTAYTIFNNSTFDRSGDLVLVDSIHIGNGAWCDSNGSVLSTQHTTEGWLVRVDHFAAFEAVTIHFEPSEAKTEVIEDIDTRMFHYDELNHELTTPYYILSWNECGQLTRIYDREAGRSVLSEGECGNVLQVFEDKPLEYDAWDIDIYYQQCKQEVNALQSMNVLEVGPLRGIIRFEWSYGSSRINQDLIVYANSRRIDFITKVDWHEQQQLLKVAFPVDIRATEATYDIQFGNVRRPTHWNTSWDYARFETVGHQWVDLSERGYGVSLLNDCKYGHDIKDRTIRLSLIKSAIFPDPVADQGEHQFTYSLYPHSGDWLEGCTVKEAWSLNQPLYASKGMWNNESGPLFRLSSGNLMIDAIKKAEDQDALIMRLHEYSGASGVVEIECGFSATSWQEVDLLERPIGESRPGNQLEFMLKPYEIKTFMIIC